MANIGDIILNSNGGFWVIDNIKLKGYIVSSLFDTDSYIVKLLYF